MQSLDNWLYCYARAKCINENPTGMPRHPGTEKEEIVMNTTNHYLSAVINLMVVVPVILILPMFILAYMKIAQTAQIREIAPEPKQVSLKVEDRHNNTDELTREDVLKIARAIINDPYLCKDRVTITNNWKIVHVGGNIPDYSWDCYTGEIKVNGGCIFLELIDIGPGRLWPPGPSDGRIDDFDILQVFAYNIGGKRKSEIMDKGIRGPELQNKHYTEILKLVKENIQDIY